MVNSIKPTQFCFFILAVFFLFLSPASAYCQENTEEDPLDDLVFKIAVIGPSDEIFIWWGHAALIVENTRLNYPRVFDWGVFSYPGDDFLKAFVQEEVQYKVTSSYLNLRGYMREDRDIVIYTLDLDRKAKGLMLAYAEDKVLPENCYYDYHEFRDNCSTGVRDLLDLGLGGQFKAAFENSPGRYSYRQHALRFTWFRPFSEWLLGFLMGGNLDGKISPWEEMFLPVEIGRNIVDFYYTDDSGSDRKLVHSVEIANSSKERTPISSKPLSAWPFFLMIGLLVAALLLCLRFWRKSHPLSGRIIVGLIQSLIGLFLGASGSVLVFGLFFLNNDYIQQNINIWFVNPLLFIVVPLGIMAAVNKSLLINSEKALGLIWTYVFAAGCVSFFIRAMPFFYQQNESVYALILPISFALSVLPTLMFKMPGSGKDHGQT